MELLWDGGTKICSNGPGHMTKMAAMPIYGKNLFFYLLRNQKPMALKLGVHNRVLEYYQVCSNYDPGLTLTYFTARSNIVPYAFVWGKKGKTMDFFKNYCSLFYDLKLNNRWLKWQEVSVDIKTLSHGGCMPPPPGLYTCIKSWIFFLYKIRLQRDFFETSNKWVKW